MDLCYLLVIQSVIIYLSESPQGEVISRINKSFDCISTIIEHNTDTSNVQYYNDTVLKYLLKLTIEASHSESKPVLQQSNCLQSVSHCLQCIVLVSSQG